MMISQIKLLSQSKISSLSFNQDSSKSPECLTPAPLSSVKDIQIAFFHEAREEENSLFIYYFSKAVQNYEKSEYFSAIHSFKRALAYSPLNFETFINLGACYYHLQLLDEAVIVFGKSSRILPESPIPHINKVLAQLQIGDLSQVMQTIDNALEILSNPPEDLYKLRTFVLCQTGKVTNFLDDLKKNNGFEPKKRLESRKLITPSTDLSIKPSRPQTSSKRRKTNLVQLYPEGSRTFIKVNEVSINSDKRTTAKNTSSRFGLHSATISPKDKQKTSRSHTNPKVKPMIYRQNTMIQKQQIEKVRVYSSEPKQQYKPGVIQINALEKEEEYFETFEAALKFNQKMRVLRHYVAKDLQKTEELRESSKDNDFEFITENQIKFLTEELSKKVKSLEKIDKIASKLEFLQKFPLHMRESIYLCAKIETFSPGDVVFREGDPGESMYVIIKGSVVINKRLSEVRNHPVIISSLYDGRQFGDVSVLSTVNEKEPRKGTCIVTEPSTMLTIPKKEYKRLLFKYLKPELEAKVAFLATLRLFKDIELNSLYTLASNVISKTYQLGDLVLKKGEMPKGLYIVTSGHLEVVTEGLVDKRPRPMIYGNAKIRQKSPRPFYTGNYSPEGSPKPQSFDLSYRDKGRNVIDAESPKKNNQKSCSFQDHNKVKDSILNFTLHPTEYFGGRSVLDNEVFQGNFHKASPSKFSFIARSSEVGILLILKEHMQFLDAQAEFIVKSILSKGFHIDSPDDIDANEMDELFKKWHNYRNEVVENIHKQKYLERNKQDFPFVR
jgi:CRP-like cAMP-binding protein/tetratricopeptide (TPR) repeat protein